MTAAPARSTSCRCWSSGSPGAGSRARGASAHEQSRPSGQLTDVMVQPRQAAGVAGCCQVTPPSEVIATPEPPAYRQCRASPHDIRKPGTELDFGGTLSVSETDQVRPWSAECMTTTPGPFPGTYAVPCPAETAPMHRPLRSQRSRLRLPGAPLGSRVAAVQLRPPLVVDRNVPRVSPPLR